MTNVNIDARFESSNKIINTLLVLSSGLVHELRNELSIINMNTEMALSNIRDRAKSANRLLTDVHDYIKATANQSNTLHVCNISSDIEDALKQFSESDLITVFDSNFTYMGVSTLTVHVISNIVRNAIRIIKHSGKGKITIATSANQDFNILIVRDTSIGIDKSLLPKIFDLFVSRSNSSGIGLAFAKTIMTSYGGNIVCNSVKDKFTEFTLFFPKV